MPSSGAKARVRSRFQSARAIRIVGDHSGSGRAGVQRQVRKQIQLSAATSRRSVCTRKPTPARETCNPSAFLSVEVRLYPEETSWTSSPDTLRPSNEIESVSPLSYGESFKPARGSCPITPHNQRGSPAASSEHAGRPSNPAAAYDGRPSNPVYATCPADLGCTFGSWAGAGRGASASTLPAAEVAAASALKPEETAGSLRPLARMNWSRKLVKDMRECSASLGSPSAVTVAITMTQI
eukprot:scaffold10980_cov125-Isochrysis_galbana.AAC.6